MTNAALQLSRADGALRALLFFFSSDLALEHFAIDFKRLSKGGVLAIFMHYKKVPNIRKSNNNVFDLNKTGFLAKTKACQVSGPWRRSTLASDDLPRTKVIVTIKML